MGALGRSEDMKSFLSHFIGSNQMYAIRSACRGEEGQWFQDKLRELATLIENMPKTYEQDGKGEQAIAYLHYFTGGCDWWITEKDAGTPEEPGQHQAFGRAKLGYEDPELGYISIPELLANGAELDLHFTPKTLAEITNSLETPSTQANQ